MHRHGPEFLWRFMPGRDSTPAESYLALWWDFHRQLLGWLGLAALLAALVWLGLRVARRRSAPPSAEQVSTGQLLLVLAWFGLAAGLLEGYYLGAKMVLWRELVPDFREVSLMSVWLAPLVTGLLLPVVCLPLVTAKLLRPTTPLLKPVLAIGIGYLFFVPVIITGRLHWAAVALLGLGLALRLAPLIERGRAEFMTVVRGSLPLFTAAVLLALAVERVHQASLAAETDRPARQAGDQPAGPNILWLVLDTERASSTSLYGFSRPTTPFLERLAERAVVFERAIAAESWTLPSHASMFTSRFNTELGTWFHAGLDARHPTVAEVLRDAGYLTAGFVANFSFTTDEFFGLNRGFQLWRDQPLTVGMALASSWPGRTLSRAVRRLAGTHTALVSKRADRVISQFMDWRREAPEGPYFAFLNFFDAHDPYLPVSEPVLPTSRENARYWVEEEAPASAYTPQELVDLRENYEAAIAYLDSQVASLFDSLTASGELDSTIVIITSDHGEHFGEHGRMGHVNTLYLPALQVPLLIMGPGVAEGRRVHRPVSLTELPVTVLQLANLPAGPFLGASLSRFWAPVPDRGPPRPAFSGSNSVSLVTERWHYLGLGQGEELYYLENDPYETIDLAAHDSLQAVLSRLRRAADSIKGTGSRIDFTGAD